MVSMSHDLAARLGDLGARHGIATDQLLAALDRSARALAALRAIEQLEGALFRLFYKTEVLRPLTERLGLFG
jgi:hypothetical protein